MSFALHTKAKLLPPDTFLGHKKCVCGRSSALGELTAPPDPLAEFVERRRRDREGKGREREREGKRKGGEMERKEREGEEGKGVKVAPKRQAWILL